MLEAFDGLLWLLVLLLALVFLQRALHREIQAVLLIMTRNPSLTMGMFSLLFFPGIFLHEISHFLAARLLGVQTGGFSLLPRARPDGRLQLGYVETARTSLLREALIGVAPLIVGGLFVAYAAIYQMDLLFLWDLFRSAQWQLFWQGVSLLPVSRDIWLWFYLTFAVSSTMMPSASDRHAWLPLGLWAGGLVGLALLAGAGPWMMNILAAPVNDFMHSVAMLFGLSAVVHAVLVLPIALVHRILSRATGLDVTSQ